LREQLLTFEATQKNEKTNVQTIQNKNIINLKQYEYSLKIFLKSLQLQKNQIQNSNWIDLQKNNVNNKFIENNVNEIHSFVISIKKEFFNFIPQQFLNLKKIRKMITNENQTTFTNENLLYILNDFEEELVYILNQIEMEINKENYNEQVINKQTVLFSNDVNIFDINNHNNAIVDFYDNFDCDNNDIYDNNNTNNNNKSILNEKNLQTNNEIIMLTKKIKNFQKKSDQIKEENENLELKLLNIENVKNEKIQNLKSSLLISEATVLNLTKENKKIENLNNSLQFVESENKHVQKLYQESIENFENLEKKYFELETQLSTKNFEIEKYNEQIASLKQKNSETQEVNKQLKNQNMLMLVNEQLKAVKNEFNNVDEKFNAVAIKKIDTLNKSDIALKKTNTLTISLENTVVLNQETSMFNIFGNNINNYNSNNIDNNNENTEVLNQKTSMFNNINVE
jgi:hypothetical protein